MSLLFSIAACGSVLAGVAIQLVQPQLWNTCWYEGLTAASGLGLAAVGWWHLSARRRMRPQRRVRLQYAATSVCLLLVLLAFGQTGWRAAWRMDQRLPASAEGVNLSVQGEVIGLPHDTGEGVRFQFRAERVNTPSGELRLPCAPDCVMSLGWYGLPTPSVRSGERWRLPVKLKAPHGHVNPHGFDYELWLWEQHIMATGYVRPQAHAPQRLSQAQWWSMSHWRERARDAVRHQVSEPETAGLIAALLLGDQASMAQSDWNVFRATGVAHLMAISGLHITGMAWLAGWVVGALWRHAHWRGVGAPLWCATPTVSRMAAVAMAMLYAAFSGWGVPAQRTVWMLCIVHALAWQGRRWPWPLTWSFVAALLVGWDPWAMLQAGFALSFMAVGLLFVSAQDWGGRTQSALARLWHEQKVMSVCLAPLSLVLFHQVSLVGLLANLWAVPWVTLVVTPLCMLGLCLPDAWLAAAWALEVMRPLLQSMASWPLAQWSLAAAPFWVGAAAVMGGVVMALPGPWGWRITGLCWCIPLLTWQIPRPALGQFELWAADMGQGHAVLVRTLHHALLYDTGPRYSRETDAGERVIVPLLRALNERLDRVVVSHQDVDHSGGLRAVMAMQPQADVLTSVALTHPMMAGLRAGACHQGQRWQWDGVEFEVLHPPASLADDRASKPNAHSCVLRIRAADGVNALLVGDIEAEQERRLLAAGALTRTNWLLVPHHGSNTSSTWAFLQTLEPSWAVVQAGYRNRYGHPRQEVMQRYAELGLAVVQTPQCGASVWRSHAPQEMQCEREVHPHYWHHKVP